MASIFARRVRLPASFSACRYASHQSRRPTSMVTSVSKSALNLPGEDSFLGVGISKELSTNLHNRFEISKPNAVQMKVIPHILHGRDLMIQSETGSGKTLSFLLPLLDKSKHICSTLIIVPTRELAVQILRVANTLKPPTQQGPFAIGLVSGLERDDGTAVAQQILKLAPRVVVATPKRLLQVMNVAPQVFFTVKHVVMDEVDRLIPPPDPLKASKKTDFHPKPAVIAMAVLKEELLKGRSSGIQLIGVSATLSHTMRAELVDIGFSEKARLVYMQDKIAVPSSISHRFALFKGENRDKGILLTQVFQSLGVDKALVFVHNGAPIDAFVANLKKKGVLVEALHHFQADPKSLDSYEAFLSDFQSGAIQMVVANEATVRGLDFPFVEHVILMEVPTSPASYVHLAGRCSRGGKPGIVTIVACPDDIAFPNLKRIYNKLDINAQKVAPFTLEADDGKVWDTEGALVLTGEHSGLTVQEEEQKRVKESGEDQTSSTTAKKKKKKGPVLEEDDDDAFDLNQLESNDDIARLLHSEHGVPVLTDLPYDTARLDSRRMRPDEGAKEDTYPED